MKSPKDIGQQKVAATHVSPSQEEDKTPQVVSAGPSGGAGSKIKTFLSCNLGWIFNASDRNDDNITSRASTSKEWRLEESSVWWLSHDIFQHPGNVLLMASIPLCAGTYFGYTKHIEQVIKDEVALAASPKTLSPANMAATAAECRALGFAVASRALWIATIGSIGTFTMIGAASFYAFGYNSVEAAIQDTKRWSSLCFHSFENWLGVENRPSKTHPELSTIKHMTEDEELEYLYRKYIQESPNDHDEKRSTS